MSSSIRVRSNLCAKTTKVTVSMNGEGNFDVDIKTDCDNIKNFASRVKTLTMQDLVDKEASLVNNTYREISMSANCMVPAGVLTAAWMEAGLISKSRANAVQNSMIEYLDE